MATIENIGNPWFKDDYDIVAEDNEYFKSLIYNYGLSTARYENLSDMCKVLVSRNHLDRKLDCGTVTLKDLKINNILSFCERFNYNTVIYVPSVGDRIIKLHELYRYVHNKQNREKREENSTILTKREIMAMHFMASLTNVYWDTMDEYSNGNQLVKCQAETAVEMADILLKELNK